MATKPRTDPQTERPARGAAAPTERPPRGAAGPSARGAAAPTEPHGRQTASARREALVEAAVEHFAMTGLHGTAVSSITNEVGITQPYAFSLFGTKKGLFLAAVEHGFDRVEEAFRAAAPNPHPEGPLMAMAEAYGALLDDRRWLLVQLQAYAACGDPEVREIVRRRYAELYELVRELSGANVDELRDFFAKGMLLNVAAAMDLPDVFLGDDWVAACLGRG
jgi:AcrR family transcriptional regulator